MKNFLLFALAISLFFLSCNKDNDDNNNNNNNNSGTEYVKLKFNGVSWLAVDGGTSYINTNTNTLAISGDNDTAVMTITLNDITTTGTYDLNTVGAPGLSFLLKTGSLSKNYSISAAKTKSSGTITINDLNPGPNFLTYIQGTFSGVAYYSDTDSIVISNGEFKQD